MSKLHIENCDVDQDEAIRKLKERGFTITPPDEKIVVECGFFAVSEIFPPAPGYRKDKVAHGVAEVINQGERVGAFSKKWTLEGLRELCSALTEWLDRHDMRENGGDVCKCIIGAYGNDKEYVPDVDSDGDLVSCGYLRPSTERVNLLCRSLRQAVIKHKDGGCV